MLKSVLHRLALSWPDWGVRAMSRDDREMLGMLAAIALIFVFMLAAIVAIARYAVTGSML